MASTRDKAVRLYKAGHTIREVSEMLGRSQRTISEWTVHLRPPRDPLADAHDYGDELTPEQNRRRLAELRAGVIRRDGSKASLPGQASNAGISQRMPSEQREALKQGVGRRGR